MKRLFKLLLFTALSAITARGAESPTFIPFQGRITDQSGNTYTNGQYTILFQLYNQAVGGTAIWQERHDKVGVVNGLVNVFLGSITPLPDDFSSTRHLGITIDADGNSNTPEPEMVPRQMIIPAFWAKNSEKLAGRDWTPIFGTNSPVGPLPAAKIEPFGITASQIRQGAIGTTQIASNAVQTWNIADNQITAAKLSPELTLDSVIPPGTIQAFGGNNFPAGWLMCDGRGVSSGQYPRLYSAISTNWGAGVPASTNNFNLPDLRGLFLRGVTGTRTNAFGDPDFTSRTNSANGGATANNVGSLQSDQFAAHRHKPFDVSNATEQMVPVQTSAWHGALFGSSGPDNAPNTGLAGGNETRPKNAYVHYIIKY